jgi:hypothetical protein
MGVGEWTGTAGFDDDTMVSLFPMGGDLGGELTTSFRSLGFKAFEEGIDATVAWIAEDTGLVGGESIVETTSGSFATGVRSVETEGA